MVKNGVLNMFNYDKLADLIKASGKTKTFLCKQLGREPYYLRDVLKQKTAVPYEYQVILAKELNTTVEYLNDEETKKPATEVTGEDEVTNEILGLLGDLDQEAKRKAKDYIQYLKSTME